MAFKRSTLMLILMAAAVSVALFVVKYRVQGLDEQLLQINRDAVQTQESIHVLKSEWSHLNQPDRLRQLAGRYLEMGPLDSERIGRAERIFDALAPRPKTDEEAPDETQKVSQ